LAENSTIEKLTKSLEFQKILKHGSKINASHWLVVSYLPNNLGHLRVGWTTTRTIGNAVIRNKLKRWCREFLKSHEEYGLLATDISVYFRVKRNKDFYKDLRYKEFDDKFSKAFEILKSKIS